MVYATCSVLPEENEDIVEYALVEVGCLRPIPVFEGELARILGRGSSVRIGPGRPEQWVRAPKSAPPREPAPFDSGPDGFFVAAFERSS